MRMETLDRIVDIDPGVRGSALRNVPNTLAVFDSHFPRFPVLPGVLIIDSLAELAAITLGGGPWRLQSVERVRFRHFVRPGDQLRLLVEVTGDGATRGTVRVGEKTVVSVRELRLRAAG